MGVPSAMLKASLNACLQFKNVAKFIGKPSTGLQNSSPRSYNVLSGCPTDSRICKAIAGKS
jgi:hypothetical protein